MNEKFIYVLASALGSKIGLSQSMKSRRVKLIGNSLPFEREMVREYIIPDSIDLKNLEEELHELFKIKRIGGKWFDLDNKDLEFIDDYLVKYKVGIYLRRSPREYKVSGDLVLSKKQTIDTYKGIIDKLMEQNTMLFQLIKG